MSIQVPATQRSAQGAMACRCGREKVLALGLCATCYTLKRHDEAYFGGLREAVLERDGYACRVCGAVAVLHGSFRLARLERRGGSWFIVPGGTAEPVPVEDAVEVWAIVAGLVRENV